MFAEIDSIDSRLIGLGIALGIGLLVGMEREWAEDKPIGLRSFALIGLLGGLCALLPDQISSWALAAGVIALGIIVALRRTEGLTTCLAALVVLLLGAAAVSGLWLHSIVATGIVTLLLHWKAPLHDRIERLGQEDFETIARFVLITLVILPILPNKTYGPYDVFNPFEAWLLVVLIVAINLIGFIALRLFGASAGVWMAGVLGGFVSSTATTVSYAGASKKVKGFGLAAALVILVASTVVYLRIGIELLIVAPGLLTVAAAPMICYAVFMLGLCGITFLIMRRKNSEPELPESKNPAGILPALTFGGIYVAILFAVAAAQEQIGDDAIFLVALVSGLTDVDALTLSVANLFSNERLGEDHAWRAIFIGSLSNLAFKAGAASFLGSADLRRWILLFSSIALAAGGVLLWLWP